MRETCVDRNPKMALPVQNINHSAFRSMFEREKLSRTNFNDWLRRLKLVLRVEKKMFVIEQPIPPAPAANSEANVLAEQFENYSPYDMLQELKSMFEKQARVERFDLIQTFHACKHEEGKPVGAYVLKMKDYVEQLERLGYVLPQDLSVGLILNGLTSNFTGFVRNYNMHNMGKTIGELHAMLIEYEKVDLKKAETQQVMMIKGAKDDTCHHCKEVGHWRRNCPVFLAELLKKKKQVGTASSSGIFTIELFAFLNKSWVYDTGCGTHVCITKQGFREARKLKQGALYLYVGNGVRAQVEAIGSFDLVLPNGLVICLDNCHYAPSITRGVVSVQTFVEIGFCRPVDGVSGGSVGNGGKLGRPVDGVSGGSVGNGGKLGRPVDGVSGGSVGNGGKPTGRPGNDGVGKPGRPGKNKRWRAAVGWRFPEKTRAEMREKMMRVVVEAI
ncbi:retrotransposon protein, putative, ty1-copia subclass [Tanacetum coccineum]